MLNTNYRAVVAAVLVGAVLFSPLLYGMTCLEAGGEKPSAEVEVMAPAAGELAREFAGSGVVGCVLTHVIFNIDVSEWVGAVQAETWVWVGVEAMELAQGVLRTELLWE